MITPKQIKKKLRKVESRARGAASIVDVAARITAAIALIMATDNDILSYVAAYLGTTAGLEIAYSLYGKNAKPLDK